MPLPIATPVPEKAPDEKPKENTDQAKPTPTPLVLFPTVIIMVPTPDASMAAAKENTARPERTPTIESAKTDGDPQPTPFPSILPSKPKVETKPTPFPSLLAQNDPSAPVDGRPRIVEGKPTMSDELKPCTVTVSEDSITLQNGGGDLAVIVGQVEDGDLESLTAISTSPENVSVRREAIPGVRTRALYVVRSISSKSGVYQVKFEMPCGRKELVVKVK